MKKMIAAILAGCVSLALFSGCAKKSDALVVGVDDQFAPMGFRDENNNLVGFDIDLAKAVGEKMGRKVEIQAINWNNKISELNGGSVDLIWNGFTITDERKEKVLFTKPYLANEQILVVKADNTSIKSINDLEGKKVVLQADSTALEAFEKTEVSKKVKPTQVKDNVTALMEIKNGTSDAIVIDSVVADYYMKKDPDTYKKVGDALAPEEYGVGVKLGNTELLDELQKAMDECIADGTAAKISQEWFGEDKLLK